MSYQAAEKYSSCGQSESALSQHDQEKVVEYLRLVKIVVKRMIDRLPSHVEADDLEHCGILGLIDAVRKFSWGREREKEEFQAYALVRIRGQILDELRSHDVLSRSARDKVSKYRKAELKLRQELSREPTVQELSEALDVSLDELYRLKGFAGFGIHVSMDSSESPAAIMHDVLLKTLNIVSPNTPEALIHIEQIKVILSEEIEGLKIKEQQVISLYYLEELTLKEIGQALDITESRVSQIHGQAISLLMKRLKAHFDLDVFQDEIK